MNTVIDKRVDSSWPEYYQAFPEFSEDTVRLGCEPRRMLHANGSGKAIVLVHGLTDSPYFMIDLADYFYTILGYDVYVPLLQCHGLRSPNGMAGVSLAEWKKNVHFALNEAGGRSEKVSIGGLSTGGALSFYMGCTSPKVTGDLYLFSAALGLAPVLQVVPGWLQEWLLRIPVISLFDNGKPLIGGNPYRYERVSINCAKELAFLIKENDRLRRGYSMKDLFEKRIFAVTTGFDTVVSVPAVNSLKEIVADSNFVTFNIEKEAHVEHACVVLKEPVYAINSQPSDPPLEKANPYFSEMTEQIRLFTTPSSINYMSYGGCVKE
jgi:pimeloyl-ACP methyl ester carboxylesterase